MEKRQDIVLGLIFVSIGIFAAWMATNYKGASGIYPMVLGLVLTLLGATVAIKALRQPTNQPRTLIDVPAKLVTAALVATIYVALVMPLGFYTASFLLVLTMPLALGFRRLAYALVVALVFMPVVFLVFSVLLEKPLPREVILSLIAVGR
ncbi:MULTISPECIES: tripartite tricarboxylate transporter TctB family protein [Roseobacteraceae]|uniref:Tripartite tricarboxylate transporter TctB family protein n=1 Tax=Pseudosulfitobacter pseudonitzschiae TaxID=1402135 RepID=A0A221JZ71_9RHOB|nr:MULTISPECIES: tripartite tricarboxylate transporter TctB family protein [Roseobacteraceae]ASM72026.1 tripartite tricarboxylate transporter TctB family protein [Pseudosulfitobacter pseudonitzschiae]